MTQPLSRERRIDWARILANLQTAGMSLQEVADWLEVGKSTLRGYTDPDIPSEPAYWVGHCLVLLWCERCERKLEELPTLCVDTRPRSEIFRSSVSRNERITSALEQLSFAWFGAVPESAAVNASDPFTMWPQRVRFRFGLARTPWDARQVSAFVVYDEATERRVQGSREFIKWLGDWQEYALDEVRDSASVAA